MSKDKKMSKVAVIGSNSFSGSHFVNTLLKETNYEVVGISRSQERSPAFLSYKEREGKRFTFYQMDLNHNLDEIADLIRKEEIGTVVNYAAQGMVGESWKNPEQWFRTNCLGTVNLTTKLMRIPSLRKYIHISTNEVYGSCNNVDENTPLNPSTPYASSKAAADMFIQNLIDQFDFPANLVRSTNVYGPGQELFRIIPRSIIYMKLNKKIQLHGGGKAAKSYLYVVDNSDGTLKIIQSGDSGKTYHLSPDSGITIENVVRKICNQFGKDFDESVEIVSDRQGQDSEYTLDSNKVRTELNWKPNTEFDKGLEKCVQWVDDNWEFIKTQPLEYIHKP